MAAEAEASSRDRADEAARAFSRTVQLDSKTGEAWNNLAALHLKAGRTRAAHVDGGEPRFRRERVDQVAVRRPASMPQNPLCISLVYRIF